MGKLALAKQGRYANANQMKRARREQRKLRTYLGRVIRDIERKADPTQLQRLSRLLTLAKRIHQQQRKDHGKVYSVQAPEVECIAKGKVPKHYEFGCKVRIVTTSRRGWIVGIDAEHNNPYEGATLKPPWPRSNA